MGKKSAPPPPDYTPVLQAAQAQVGVDNAALSQQQAQAAQQLQLSQQQVSDSETQAAQDYALQQNEFNWAQGQANANQALEQPIVNADVATQQQASAIAAQDQAQYESTYVPLEQAQAAYATGYDTPQREQQNAGAASAAVANQFNSQRIAAAQNLEQYGIDPSSTRYAALDTGVRTAQAAAQAAAGQTAILNTQATGQSLEQQAINTGMGVMSGANTASGVGIGAGNAAANTALSTTNTGANTMGTSVQYGGLGTGATNAGTSAVNSGSSAINAGNGLANDVNGAISSWGNTTNEGYNNQLQAFNANQAASSGLGSLFGTVLGSSSLASGASGLGMLAALADGGTVPSAVNVPAPSAVPTSGGAIPVSASPSGGQAVDDVPARLTAGEFVIPRDVMQWKGEEQIQKLIQKSRQDRGALSVARPRAVAAPMQPAAFTSRPQPVSAIPMR